MKEKLDRIQKFIFYDIWHMSLDALPKSRKILLRQLRIFLLAIRGYQEDNIPLRASALTFFTLISVVPVVALLFAIAKGFGAQKMLEEQLSVALKGHEEVFTSIMEFANNMLANTSGGWIAGIGIVILFWSVIKVLWSMEESFNHIWHQKKNRSYVRKLSDYLSIIIVAPIIIILTGSSNIFISTQLTTLTQKYELLQLLGPYILFLLKFFPYLLIWILLTLLYMVIPNVWVDFKSAVYAAVLAGTAFQLTQMAYLHFQVGVTRYNAIYGSFAALPLFLIFLQIAWLIVLFGAELSYASQNVKYYEYADASNNMSIYNRKLACMTVLHAIVKAFEFGENPPSEKELSLRFQAPMRMIKIVIRMLTEAKLIKLAMADTDNGYLPAIDINKINIGYILNALDNTGEVSVAIVNDPHFNAIKEKLDEVVATRDKSGANVLLKDL